MCSDISRVVLIGTHSGTYPLDCVARFSENSNNYGNCLYYYSKTSYSFPYSLVFLFFLLYFSLFKIGFCLAILLF